PAAGGQRHGEESREEPARGVRRARWAQAGSRTALIGPGQWMCEKRPVPARTRRALAQVRSRGRGPVNRRTFRAAWRLLNQVPPPPCGRGGSMKPNSLLLLATLLATAPAFA